MTEETLFGGLALAHVWQSLAVAAVLALALVFGRKLSGATRYWLAGAAFVACLALPLAAFIPGESILRYALKSIDAPVSLKTQAQVDAEHAAAAKAATPAEPHWFAEARKSGAPEWSLALGDAALKTLATTPATDAPKKADGTTPTVAEAISDKITAEGGPAWAARIGTDYLKAQAAPAAAPRPLFTLPQVDLSAIKMPDLSFLGLPLLFVWVAGTVIMLVRTGRDLIAVERLTRRAEPVALPPSLQKRMRGIRVAVSSEAPGPMAAGLFRPVVVLPESSTKELNSPGVAALLEHERAHIERKDMAIALVQRVILALLWWSPALHWISRRIDEERELACDEAAVERTGDARAFARSLTTQAENQLWARAPRLAVGAIGPRSQFGRRIKRLIDIAKAGGAPVRYSGRVAFSALAVAVAVAALVTPRLIAEASPARNVADPSPLKVPGAQGSQREDVKFVDRKSDPASQVKALANVRDRDSLDNIANDIENLMQGVASDLQVAVKDVDRDQQDRARTRGRSKESDPDLDKLSAQLSQLGAEIGAQVSEQLAEQLPEIMDQVRESLADARAHGWDGADSEEFRRSMEQLREELRTQLGPEFREKIRKQAEDARREAERVRAEVEKNRPMWEAQARAGQEAARQGQEAARQAMEQARKEIEAARARGDFNFDFDWDKFDSKWTSKLDGDWSMAGKLDGASTSPLTKERQLYSAASRGDADKVQDLIKAGANVNASSPGLGTPLIIAARHGELDTVRLLLDRGANPNTVAPGVGNALIGAVSHGELDVVKLLLARGADVNALVPGSDTALLVAAKRGEFDIAKVLVEKGADMNRRSMAQRSAVATAERYGHDEIADYLRSKGAK